MATLLEKRQAAADKRRKALAAKGRYEFTVTIFPQVAGNALEGTGTTDGTPTVLNAGVSVVNVSEKAVTFSSGVLQVGDIIVEGISRLLFSESLLTDVSHQWEIVGPVVAGRYKIVKGKVDRKDTEYRVFLRRVIQ